MNKDILVDIRDITDSKELLSEKPHRSMVWFIYILIALIAAVVIWSCIGEIDQYVKSQGELRPNDKVSTIKNTITGRVLESNLSEGKYVQKGDLLFSMDVEMQADAEAVLQRQYDNITKEIRNIEKYRDSIVQDTNLFDMNDPDEWDYYYKFQKYETDKLSLAEQVRNTNVEYDKLLRDARVSRETANISITKINNDMNALSLLQQSITSGENMVPKSNSEQHNRYVDYQISCDRYNALIERQTVAADKAEQLYTAGGISKKEYENAQYELNMTLSEYEQYKNEVQISITQSIEGLGKSLDDLQYSLKSANTLSASYSQKGYSEELALEKIKLDTLEAISESLFSLQNSSDSLLRDLNSIKLSISESNVIAPIDGTVNLYTDLNAGDYLQNGTEIATIIPGADGDYKVLLAVLNEDIADITVGQQVYYRFSALPFSEYGELSGKITKISTDARNGNSGQSYYLVEAEIENRTLYSKKNVPAEIKVGMTVEARVVTKSQKIIFWALDKLNIFDWT